MSQLLMAQIAKLHRMPDLAESLEHFQPQPDEYTETMKQLEIKGKEAEIEERLSRARENEVDIRAKNAKAALDEARAKNLNSDTDKKDLDFTRSAQGIDHQERMAEQGASQRATLAGKEMDNRSKENLKLSEVLTRQ